jgi:hypothetical protein
VTSGTIITVFAAASLAIGEHLVGQLAPLLS